MSRIFTDDRRTKCGRIIQVDCPLKAPCKRKAFLATVIGLTGELPDAVPLFFPFLIFNDTT